MAYLFSTSSFLLILTIFSAGGNFSPVKSNDTLSAARQNFNKVILPTSNRLNEREKYTPEFFFGGLEMADGKFEENSVWTHDAGLYNKERGKEISIANRMEVDVMNCGADSGSSGCVAGQHLNVEAEDKSSLPANTTLPAKKVIPTPTPDFKVSKVESKLPLVWIGGFEEESLRVPKANGNVWNNGNYNEDNHPEYTRIGTSIEVDIMNCAGYLISGRLNNVDLLGWRLETIPETAARDAAKKLKQCAGSDKKFPDNDAFAVAPQNKNRKDIKIEAVDTRKLYASLPRKSREWLEENKKIYKFSSSYRRKEKKNLTLRDDNWTDTDGDGKIDLVEISAVCDKDDSEGTTCSSILMLINGKWVEVGST